MLLKNTKNSKNGNIITQFNQFRNQLMESGKNPNQILNELIKSGKISKEQLEDAKQKAQMFSYLLK